MGTYLVTGGAGFIGTHVTSRLIGDGHKVIVVDNLRTGLEENINRKSEFIDGNISNPDDVEKIPREGVDAVLHLAAQSSGEASFEDPYADFQANVGGTLLMLDWCRKNKVDRFIYISTMGVYGKNSDVPLNEETLCTPKSFYGIGKLAGENYVKMYGQLGLKTTVLRLFNVYGPKQNLRNRKQGMVSIYLSYLLAGEPIIVKGDLSRFRDQTYVGDVVDAIVLCLEKPQSISGTYNVATGRKLTVKQLINTMIEISGNRVGKYAIEVEEGTPGDLFGCIGDPSRIEKDLGWVSRYSVKEGLREMYDSFKKNG